jgi:hypothetical protein
MPPARLPARGSGEVVENPGGGLDERRAQALKQPSRPRLVETVAETRAERAFLGRSTVASGDRHAIAHAHLSAAFLSKRVEQAIETVGRLARAMA